MTEKSSKPNVADGTKASLSKTLSDSCIHEQTPDMSVPEFKQLGRYHMIRLLGKGGMGTVYLAKDTQLERPVALKIPHFRQEQKSELERFYREARTAGRLQHPNICPVFDVGEEDGVHYLSMAYIEGEPLSAFVPKFQQRSPKDAAALVHTLAIALGEAHQQGVIHRDVKPANVMINRRGEPVLMDFGLAREVQTASPSQTHDGTIMGTPAYMSPEQARGEVAAIGPGSDIYSLGVVLYELLVGQIPFEGPTMDVLVKQVRDEPIPPSRVRVEVDGCIESICLKAMAKEPSSRYLSMNDFAQALTDYMNDVRPAAEKDCSTESQQSEPVLSKMLFLIRTWGWEAGIEKTKSISTTHSKGAALPWLADLLRWLSEGEPLDDTIEASLKEIPAFQALQDWALLGQVFNNNREHNFAQAETLLNVLEAQGGSNDNILRAAIHHQWGFWHYHAGKLKEALSSLHQGLSLCGRNHFLTGEILGTLGLVYANKNNFQAAREFFEQAVQCKQQFEQERATAGGLRQLGKLYLDWGETDEAETCFQRSLQCCSKIQDKKGEAFTYHHLGQVALVRAMIAANSGRQSESKKQYQNAAEWLDASIQLNHEGGRANSVANATRDRAQVDLAENDLQQAEASLLKAEEILQNSGHAYGIAQVQQIKGVLKRQQSEFSESERLLHQALTHFDRTAACLEGTQTQLEIARTLAVAKKPLQLVTTAFLDALKRAEFAQRSDLVRIIEEELKTIDREIHWDHTFRRIRGRVATVDTTSLSAGSSEIATTVFLNLRGFIPFCQGLEAEEAMQTVNQMMTDLESVLNQYETYVTSYLGGGFMALAQGTGHAIRAVKAALESIEVVEEFNRPRVVLGLPQLPVRIGVATGSMFLGNIGTYQKMDFTAIGRAVNLAARLMRHANDRWPCISRETKESIGDHLDDTEMTSRIIEVQGIGRREVWDVTKRVNE